MSELELGQATIVYEDPEEGQMEETVDNERVVYARDHWMVVTGTDDQGNDLMRQIPKERVYYVERNVQRFEDEARTLRRRVESVAKDLRQKLPVDVGDGGRGRRGRGERGGEPPEESTKIHIDEPESRE
jgi:hypothetical protein